MTGRWIDWQRPKSASAFALEPSAPANGGFAGFEGFGSPQSQIVDPAGAFSPDSSEGFEGFAGSVPAQIQKIEPVEDHPEAALTRREPNAARVRIMNLDTGISVGIWSDLDSAIVRRRFEYSGTPICLSGISTAPTFQTVTNSGMLRANRFHSRRSQRCLVTRRAVESARYSSGTCSLATRPEAMKQPGFRFNTGQKTFSKERDRYDAGNLASSSATGVPFCRMDRVAASSMQTTFRPERPSIIPAPPVIVPEILYSSWGGTRTGATELHGRLPYGPLIIEDADRCGGEQSGLLQWARAVLTRLGSPESDEV